MGGGTWTAQSWNSYSKSTIQGKSATSIYSSQVKDKFLPLSTDRNKHGSLAVIRESRDSEDHPNSTPIILGLDVTGSMSSILETIAKKLNVVVEEVYARKPVSDPQIMFSAIGDGICDRYPLQVTQFESDIRIAEQLTELYFERGGGGNGFESYPLAWHFAGNYTECDNYEKRGKKGFIFTFGDDSYPRVITKKELEEFLGEPVESDLLTSDILTKVSRQYEVYHFNLGGSHEQNTWSDLLGERAIQVSDYDKIPEIIVSILESYSGKDIQEIVNSWDGTTGLVVKEVLDGLSKLKNNNDSDLIEF